MQKTTTPLKKTDLETRKKELSMEPSLQSIQKIMQFAANYRVQKVNKNQFVEMYLSETQKMLCRITEDFFCFRVPEFQGFNLKI